MKRYYFYEFWFYIRKKPWILFFTVLIGVVGTALMLCAGRLAKHTAVNNQKYDKAYEEGEYSILADRFFDEVEKELKAKPEYWNLLREFNNTLHSAKAFEYLEIREQFSEVFHYRGSDENLHGYENGNTVREEHRDEEVFSNIKAIWLGEEVFSHFNLAVSEGRLFIPEEFVCFLGQEQKQLPPVLMGDGFSGDYQVGDIIEVNNFVMRGQAQVVGFLEKGSSVMLLTQPQSLDRYLVFPMLCVQNQPELPEEIRFFRSLYYEKNNGLIYSDVSREDIQDIVTQECDKLGIHGAYLVCGANNQPTVDLGAGLDRAVAVICSFAVATSVFSIVVLLVYLLVKIRISKRYYAVLLINGFSQRDIAWMICAEAIVILGISGLFGIVLGEAVCHVLFPAFRSGFSWVFFSLLAGGIISVLVSIWSFWRVDLSSHLRDKID